MRRNHFTRGAWVAVLIVTGALVLIGMAGSATAYTTQYCSQVPIFNGTPEWGFHTGQPITGATGSYARGHGKIRLIIMSVQHHLVYHSHHAVMWGFPGNIMKIIVRVTSSTDPRCTVGTLGGVTIFGSYNGVRSDSVQFFFPAACQDHNHLYHGPQVNNQVPPPIIG